MKPGIVTRVRLGTLAVTLVALLACRPGDAATSGKVDTTELAARERRLSEALARPDSGSSNEPIARWLLPQSLVEISGLTIAPDGGLLAHGDETGRIFEIDYRRGLVQKEFAVGQPEARADFEGITFVGDLAVMVTSNGKLYEFPLGPNGQHVDYTVRDTRLGRECEFEGVAYDPKSSSLVLACKQIADKKLRKSLVLYRWSTRADSADRLTRMVIPIEDTMKKYGWTELRPTDITIEPGTGNYVLVAGREKAIVVVTPEGQVVSVRQLPSRHPQVEGIAITNDSILIVSDEVPRGMGSAAITLYRWR